MGRKESQGWTDIRKSGLKRLSDAEALLENKTPHGQGAKYLAGYAVECKLKAIAMEIYGCWKLEDLAKKLEIDDRDIFSHGLEALATILPIYDRLRKSHVWKDFAKVNEWRPSWRYSQQEIPNEKAKVFVDAVKRVRNWLEANKG
jgi:hypothetical protein